MPDWSAATHIALPSTTCGGLRRNADAAIAIDGDFLERVADSPIALGLRRLRGRHAARHRRHGAGRQLAVTRATATDGGAVADAGASAGVGFTVSLLVATLAFHGA